MSKNGNGGECVPRGCVRWRAAFALAWCGLAMGTAALFLLLSGGAGGGWTVLLSVVALELSFGAVGFILVDRTVFRPLSRLRKAVEGAPGTALPDVRGPLAPLSSVIASRLDRSVAALQESLRDRDERLAQVERLRRALEETRANLESSVRYLRTIAEVSTAVAGTLDPEELYRILPERVMRKLGLNDFTILLYSRETQRLVAKFDLSAGEGAPPFSIAPGEGVAGRVFVTGEPAWFPDLKTSPGFPHYVGRRADVRSFLCVPLLSKGRSIGVLMLHHPEPNAFEPELLPAMRVLASHLAIAIENAELFGFVKSLAEKDSLTLLYNHGAFHEKLSIERERATRYGRPLSVIMLDLDRFKEINDRYGHTTGDRVLVLVAGVLGAHLRKTDIAARYGGDEFAVILPETDIASAAVIAERVSEGIASVRLDIERGETLSFSASIGYAACAPESPMREEILNVADRQMYESKRKGPGGVLGTRI